MDHPVYPRRLPKMDGARQEGGGERRRRRRRESFLSRAGYPILFFLRCHRNLMATFC